MFNIKLFCVSLSVISVVYASLELNKSTRVLNDNNDSAVDSVVNIDKMDYQAKNYDEIDPVLDMLLNNEYDNPVEPSTTTDQQEGVDSQPMLYPYGVWKCGNCTNMKQLRLLYSETYDHDTNYDEYTEEINMEIQIGLSLRNMRCITMEAEEDIDVRLVSGTCSGEQATLGVMRASHCVVSVYG